MVTALEQYPHYLYMETAGTTTVDANGDRVPGDSEWIYVGRCREETNGKGESVVTSDQKLYIFSSLVQMPAGTEKIEEGVAIAVSSEELEVEAGISAGDRYVRLYGTCAKFDEGRLHCRMWV